MQNDMNVVEATAANEEEQVLNTFLDNSTQPAGQAENEQAQESSQETNSSEQDQAIDEQANQSETQSPEQQRPVDFDRKMEEQEWVKKRLRRQEIAFERKMQDMEQRQAQFLQAVTQPTQQQQAPNQYLDPYTGLPNPYMQSQQMPVDITNPDVIDKFVQDKVNKVLEEKLLQAKRVEESKKAIELKQEADDLKFKYDDFDEVVYSLNPYVTPEMRQTLTMLPRGSLENLYSVWKQSPDEIRRISQLPQGMQTIALAQLDAKISSKKAINQNQPTQRQNGTSSPVKTKAVVSSSSWNDDYESLVKDYLNKR
jgi:hypothetical protein